MIEVYEHIVIKYKERESESLGLQRGYFLIKIFFLKVAIFQLFLLFLTPNPFRSKPKARENLDDGEGQTDSTPVDKFYFTLTTKAFRCYPKIQSLRASIEVNMNNEYRGARCPR